MHKLIIAAAASAGLLALGACADPAPEQETTAEQMPGDTTGTTAGSTMPPADSTMPPAGDPTMQGTTPADPNNPTGTPPTLPEDQTSPPAQ